VELHTLKGDPYKDADGKHLVLGDVVAEVLAMDQTGGKMKLYSLAERAYKGEEMEVDAADMTTIKRSFDGTKAYNGNALILGQALQLLERVKE